MTGPPLGAGSLTAQTAIPAGVGAVTSASVEVTAKLRDSRLGKASARETVGILGGDYAAHIAAKEEGTPPWRSSTNLLRQRGSSPEFPETFLSGNDALG